MGSKARLTYSREDIRFEILIQGWRRLPGYVGRVFPNGASKGAALHSVFLLTWIQAGRYQFLSALALPLPNGQTCYCLHIWVFYIRTDCYDEFVLPVCPVVPDELVPEYGDIVGVLVAVGMHDSAEKILFEKSSAAEGGQRGMV